MVGAGVGPFPMGGLIGAIGGGGAGVSISGDDVGRNCQTTITIVTLMTAAPTTRSRRSTAAFRSNQSSRSASLPASIGAFLSFTLPLDLCEL